MKKLKKMPAEEAGSCPSIVDVIDDAAVKYADRDCMAYSTATPDRKPTDAADFKYHTYSEIHGMIKKVAASVMKMNPQEPGAEKSKVGIWTMTSFHMRMCMLSFLKAGYVVVPVFDALGESGMSYMFGLTEVSILVVDTKDKLESVKKFKNEMPHIKYIIKVPSNVDMSKSSDVPADDAEIIPYDKLLEIEPSEVESTEFAKPSPDDLAFILSTSGSTGVPKGVLVTHANIMSVIKEFLDRYSHIHQECESEKTQVSTLSILPLAHVFGQLPCLAMFLWGGKVAYPSGDLRVYLNSDLQTVKPIILIAVPLILSRTRQKTAATISKLGFIKQTIFKGALSLQKAGIGLLGSIAFKEIKKNFGGELKLMLLGGAMLAPQLQGWGNATMGCQVIQGYGLTEGIVCVQKSDFKSSNIGVPFNFIEYKLKDVPEMNYLSENNQGELLVKGKSITQGYYKNEAATAEAFEDGYFRTGDIVEVVKTKDETQFIFKDRLKSIFKLQQGEYVAPEEVQNFYLKSEVCSQIFIYGCPLMSFCVGIGFIEKAELIPLAERLISSGKVKGETPKEALQGLSEDSILELINDALISILNDHKPVKMSSFAHAKEWYFTTKVPTPQNEMLTPTMKQKRHLIYQTFKTPIEEMILRHKEKFKV